MQVNILEAKNRPVWAVADQIEVRDVARVQVRLDRERSLTLLFDPEHAHWYDWAATMQHAAHFVLPVAVGLLIWLRSRRTYWRYLASVLTLFYLGFIGYALYPAAPPWMAGPCVSAPDASRGGRHRSRRVHCGSSARRRLSS